VLIYSTISTPFRHKVMMKLRHICGGINRET
jgi:hypothetical protein